MKTLTKIILSGAALCATLSIGQAATAEVGKAAPDFTLTDINGNQHSLAEYRGKTVVLEWVNPECPIVMKHYDRSGNMPKVQQAAAADGAVWLQINSGHPGAQGDYAPARAAAWQKRHGTVATAYFRDQDGRVGRLYDARTTPHMFVIDGGGTLVYAGGIDSIRSGNPDDIAQATNYVTAAPADPILSGRRQTEPEARLSAPRGYGFAAGKPRG
ncbi:MAG: redoxin domain-containing protein [Opitutae bacterium]|nr:redoxin domain-containing protein [Opitutae bacterium]